MRYMICSAILAVFSLVAAAQDGEAIKKQMIADWQRAKLYTGEYLDAMPASRYDFRPADSIRTFARQMLHLAQGNIGLASNGTGVDRIFPGQNLEARESAASADSVKYFVMASYDYVISGLEQMDAGKMFESTKMGNFDFTRYAWLSKAFEHQGHHRGQATIYLRAAGIKPPNERLF